MSYDLGLVDPITKKTIQLEEKHHMRGGTYQIGGCPKAHINITYNYAKHFGRVFETNSNYVEEIRGIRTLYGLSGAESIPVIKRAISMLGDDVSDNYWDSTEGNAKRSLYQCLALAQMCPDGVWDGD